MNNNVFTFSESYRRQHFFGRVPEEGADIVNFAQASVRARKRKRLEEYHYSFLQLEAEFATLLYHRQQNLPFSTRPALRALSTFKGETSAVLTFLEQIGDEENTSIHIEFACFPIDEISEHLERLPHTSSFFSYDMSVRFAAMQECFAEIHDCFAPLLHRTLRYSQPAYVR